jgi:hypothetical protein
VLLIITSVSSTANDAVMLQIRTRYTRRIVAKLVLWAGYIFQRTWNNDRTGHSINEEGLDTSRGRLRTWRLWLPGRERLS